MRTNTTKLELILPFPAEEAYVFVLEADPTILFIRYLFIPGLVFTNPLKGWEMPGRNRTLYFDNHTRAFEKVLVALPGVLFGVKIKNFDFLIGRLLKEINCNITFSESDMYTSRIAVEIAYVPNTLISYWLFRFLLKRMAGHYFKKSLQRFRKSISHSAMAEIRGTDHPGLPKLRQLHPGSTN